jgi:ABC-type phosphate transport system substrate-binding protein
MNCLCQLQRYFPVLAVCILLSGCGNGNSGKKIPQETPTSGTIHISADESFKPVLDSEVKVFESSFPDVKLIVHYVSEAECFRDLMADSTRMIIVTRGLNKEEEKFYLDSIHYVPIYGKLAYDAIAVVVNNKAKDTIFSMDNIRDLLSGQSNMKWQPVMDGVSATSTVRYAIDSILKGKPLGKNVMAAKSSEGVIDYVSKNPDAIGFIGVEWIGNTEDPEQMEFLQKVKVAAIKCEVCPNDTYVEPYQANIAMKRYPMVRGLYYILKEDFKGVGNNFVNFLQFERGQLIFRRAYLMPARMSFEIRNMQITN